MQRQERTIADAIAAWPSGLETALFGTNDATEIRAIVERYCEQRLGQAVRFLRFYRRGVGAVFGLTLADDSHVVIKIHRPELVGSRLGGIVRLQERLWRIGLPAPRPLAGPDRFARGLATSEELIDRGDIPDGHEPAMRRLLAGELSRFVAAATHVGTEVSVDPGPRLVVPERQLWPRPHDLRFDLTLPGGEWIDESATQALTRLRTPVGRQVVGHDDWRVENLRVEHDRLVAIFDWDSVVRQPEPMLVADNALCFTADWADPIGHPWPSLDESRAFFRDYEHVRGEPFGPEERETADAAHLYSLAYNARCEHSDIVLGLLPDPGPARGWRALLHERTTSRFLA